MKAPAVVAALSIVLAGGLISSAHASTGHPASAMLFHTYRFPLLQRGSLKPVMRSVLVPLQTTAATSTPTTSPTAGPTASPTPVLTPTPAYPDGATVLQNALTVYASIKSAHVKLVTVATKPDVEVLTITGTGNAFCKNLSLSLKVTGVAKLLATGRQSKTVLQFAQKGKTTLEKKSGSKAVWKKANPNTVTLYGFPYPIGNPLACPSTSGGGSGNGSSTGPTDTFKDVVNVGPDTFQGTKVWHVHLTDVRVLGGSNGTLNIPIDLLINQSNYIPYVISQTINDTLDGIVVADSQTTTKIGQKYTFKMPKAGHK